MDANDRSRGLDSAGSERHDASRRQLLKKAAYVLPVVLTFPALPSVASAASGQPSRPMRPLPREPV